MLELNETTVTIRGQNFTIRELTIGKMMPIMTQLQSGDMSAQIPLLGQSVYIEGSDTPLGDAAADLPGAVYMELIPLVLATNRMSAVANADGEAPGNA